jgi:hypothetical protein
MALTNPKPRTPAAAFPPFSPLEAFAPRRMVSPRVDVRRVRHAIEMASEALEAIPDTDEVRRLIGRAASLRAELEQWVAAPPTPEQRDELLRSVLAIHVGTLQVARIARHEVSSGPV